MLEFLARNWGNLASVVGLVFSILAFWFSKRASEAARQARELVLTRTLGEDMNMGNRTASDIRDYVAMGREDMALLRVSELINHTSFMIARWRDRLPELSKNNPLEARANLHLIHESLTEDIARQPQPQAESSSWAIMPASQRDFQRRVWCGDQIGRGPGGVTMEPSKAASFFQEVETKTARGRLKWQPTATDDLIAAIGGEFTLRLVRPTSDDEFDYALFLHDAQHRQLVRIGYQMGLPGVTSSRLKELFMIAMDQALGVDEQLERVIGVLDKL